MKKLFICFLLLKTCLSFAQDTSFYQNVEWSNDGKYICAEVIHHAGSKLFFEGNIINVAEKKTERKIAGAVFPAWSPTGKYIAYSKRNASSHGLDIWLMNILTGDTTLILNDTSRNSGLSFSPDGKKICFSSDRNGGRNLFIMNSDGNNIVRITFDTVKYFNPVWSPTGNRILYSRERGDNRDKVYMLDLSTKKEMKVTNDSLHDIYPGWLPDGKTIIYTFFNPDLSNAENQIAFINEDGNNKRILENNTGSFFARASPDGKSIAIIKGAWPTSEIFIENIDGSNPVCITCNH